MDFYIHLIWLLANTRGDMCLYCTVFHVAMDSSIFVVPWKGSLASCEEDGNIFPDVIVRTDRLLLAVFGSVTWQKYSSTVYNVNTYHLLFV